MKHLIELMETDYDYKLYSSEDVFQLRNTLGDYAISNIDLTEDEYQQLKQRFGNKKINTNSFSFTNTFKPQHIKKMENQAENAASQAGDQTTDQLPDLKSLFKQLQQVASASNKTQLNEALTRVKAAQTTISKAQADIRLAEQDIADGIKMISKLVGSDATGSKAPKSASDKPYTGEKRGRKTNAEKARIAAEAERAAANASGGLNVEGVPTSEEVEDQQELVQTDEIKAEDVATKIDVPATTKGKSTKAKPVAAGNE